MKDFDKQSVIFLGLTVPLTLLFWIPLALRLNGSAGFTGQLLLFSGGSVPSLVALGLVATTWQKEDRRDFLWRTFTLRGVRPLTFLILFIPLLINAGVFVFYAVLNRPLSLQLILNILNEPFQYGRLIVTIFLFGPLSQEIGWRGYLLDPIRRRLRAKRSRFLADFWASFVVGFIWGAWQLPLFFVIGTGQYETRLFSVEWFGFMLNFLLVSIIYTWQHHVTNRNILMAILYRFMANLSRILILASNDPLGPLWEILTILITTMFVLGVLVAPWGLEYEPPKPEPTPRPDRKT
ncbi:MAG: CPBP family glutamic-type intramembrane protease [Chloroflexota bacterium]